MSAFRIAVPAVVERTVLVAAVSLLAAASWVVLWVSDLNFHHLQGRPEWTALLRPSLWFVSAAAWTVMCVAMMLPTSLPVLAALHTLAAVRRDRGLLVFLTGLGYLAAWGVFGALVAPLSLGLQTAVATWSGPDVLVRVLAPGLLLTAGLFQFSSLKFRCLDRCRSPLSVVLSHWHGRHQRWQALRLGWASGVFCVGCCWALMLLMFLSGVGHLAWMLGLGVVMALEKNARWGRRLSTPVGVALILGAVIVLLTGTGPLLVSGTAAAELCAPGSRLP
ncbi:MAG TPA: DUF2182 domain-containing protein [Opitutaceae bacterium]